MCDPKPTMRRKDRPDRCGDGDLQFAFLDDAVVGGFRGHHAWRRRIGEPGQALPESCIGEAEIAGGLDEGAAFCASGMSPGRYATPRSRAAADAAARSILLLVR